MRLMHGTVFQYLTFPSLIAFESSPPSPSLSSVTTKGGTTTQETLSPNKCILIGGLSDGILPTPYTEKLESACHALGWSLVQPILSSSYTGFGHGSLERDTRELSQLLNCLKENRDAENVALVGHSTGCQNAIHFMKHGGDVRDMVKCIALQAPVSDREHAEFDDPNYQKNLEKAQTLKSQGNENEMMPRSCFWAPITASRFLSLQTKLGDDDFFSSDLSDEQLASRLGHIGEYGKESGLHLLAAFSGADEYVPKHVDGNLLLDRLCHAMNTACNGEEDNGDKGRKVATPLYLKNGNHNLSKGEGDMDVFVEHVANHLKLAVPSLLD